MSDDDDEDTTKIEIEGYNLTQKLGSGLTATVYCKLKFYSN